MAKIIKGEGAPSPASGRIVEAPVYEASQRATAIVAAAKDEAERILSAAEVECARAREQATEAGYQEGLGRVSSLLARAAAARDRLIAGAERELVVLAVAVAEKILGRELRLDPGAVADVAARALEEVRERRSVVLRVHPADGAAVREREAALSSLLVRCRGVEIRDDASVPRGGAIVDTEAGTVDARLETQLAALRSALEEGCGT